MKYFCLVLERLLLVSDYLSGCHLQSQVVLIGQFGGEVRQSILKGCSDCFIVTFVEISRFRLRSCMRFCKVQVVVGIGLNVLVLS